MQRTKLDGELCYYADFRHNVGFRCHPCRVISGPHWRELNEITLSDGTYIYCSNIPGDYFYEIEFVDFIPGTIAEDQIWTEVPACHIFMSPIELVDLPRECYWGDEIEA